MSNRRINNPALSAHQGAKAFEAILIANFGAELSKQIVSSFDMHPSIDDILKRYSHYDLPREFFADLMRAIGGIDERRLIGPEYQPLAQKQMRAASLRFAVAEITYASLDFKLIANNVDELMHCLDANLDAIAPMLTPFIATSFAELFSDGDASKFFATVTMEPSAQSKGSIAPPVPDKKAIAPLKNGAELLWTVANGSLLLPILLALAVLYFANRNLEHRATELQTKETKVFDTLLKLLTVDR